jgi:hypothetical protein
LNLEISSLYEKYSDPINNHIANSECSTPVPGVTIPELPRDSKIANVVISHTPAVDSASVDDVADTLCVSLFVVDEVEVAAEQVSDAMVVLEVPVQCAAFIPRFTLFPSKLFGRSFLYFNQILPR